MINRFPASALAEYLASANVAVVVAERLAAGHVYRAHALDVSDEIQAEFRDRGVRALGEYEDGLLPVPLAENTLLSEHEFAVTDRSVLDPRLLTELLRAGAVSPDRDHPPVPNLIRLSALVAQGAEHEAILMRRQNPVRHLGASMLTLNLSRSRLTRSQPIFVYDFQFDLLVYDQAVAIRSQSAFDTVFRDDQQRAAETARAVDEVARFVRPADREALIAAAGADSRYAAKLRRTLLAGVYEEVDLAAVHQTIEEFNLELRSEDGQLILPRTRSGRWELLYALEDAFVQGRATGRRYRANSKRTWSRRSIDSVVVRNNRVAEVHGPGDWSPRSAADVVSDLIGTHPIDYIARLDDGPALLEVRHDGDQRELWVAGEQPHLNRLLELGSPG